MPVTSVCNRNHSANRKAMKQEALNRLQLSSPHQLSKFCTNLRQKILKMRASNERQPGRQQLRMLHRRTGCFPKSCVDSDRGGSCGLERIGLDWHVLAQRSSYGGGRLNTRPVRVNRRAIREKSFQDFCRFGLIAPASVQDLEACQSAGGSVE